VDGTRAQEHRFHPRRKHRIPRLAGKLTIPQLMGSTDLPVRSRVLFLRPIKVGHPDGRAMVAQDVVDDPVAPAGSHHMYTALGLWKDPCPLGASVHPCAGFSTADQSTTPPARQDLFHAVVQPCLHPPEESRQGAFADGHPLHLCKERGQALVTDGMGIAPLGGQTLARGPNGRAGLHPHRDRGHIGLSTVAALAPMLLYPGEDGLDQGHLDRVIHGMEMLRVRRHHAPTMRAALSLGHDDLVRVGVPRPAPTRTAHAGFAPRSRLGAGGAVRLRAVRGGNARIVGILPRLGRFGFEGRQPGFPALHLRPQRGNEDILFRI
jgi:hypothetical protein